MGNEGNPPRHSPFAIPHSPFHEAVHGRGMRTMKGIITKALAGVALSGGLSSAGCYHYQKCVDPCWPERYDYKARQEVISAFAPQVQNGHILDQTLYNYQFDAGTDHLTDSGRD